MVGGHFAASVEAHESVHVLKFCAAERGKIFASLRVSSSRRRDFCWPSRKRRSRRPQTLRHVPPTRESRLRRKHRASPQCRRTPAQGTPARSRTPQPEDAQPTSPANGTKRQSHSGKPPAERPKGINLRRAFIGVDLEQARRRLRVHRLRKVRRRRRQRPAKRPITVSAGKFATEQLKVAPNFVEPNPEQLAKAAEDQQKTARTLRHDHSRKTVDRRFRIPLDGVKTGGNFGQPPRPQRPNRAPRTPASICPRPPARRSTPPKAAASSSPKSSTSPATPC